MPETPARRALAAASVSLVFALACTVMFLPPLVAQTTGSVPRVVAIGVVLAASLLLHWAFLGIAAHRMGRSVPGWVALSLLLYPVGSATALILLGWLGDEEGTPQALPSHG